MLPTHQNKEESPFVDFIPITPDFGYEDRAKRNLLRQNYESQRQLVTLGDTSNGNSLTLAKHSFGLERVGSLDPKSPFSPSFSIEKRPQKKKVRLPSLQSGRYHKNYNPPNLAGFETNKTKLYYGESIFRGDMQTSKASKERDLISVETTKRINYVRPLKMLNVSFKERPQKTSSRDHESTSGSFTEDSVRFLNKLKGFREVDESFSKKYFVAGIGDQRSKKNTERPNEKKGWQNSPFRVRDLSADRKMHLFKCGTPQRVLL